MPLPPPPDPALSDNQPSPRQSTHEDRPETSTSTPSSQHHSLSDPPLQSAPPDRSLVPKSRRGQWLTFVVWTQTGIEAIRLSLFVKHPLLRLLPAFVALPTTEAVQFWAIEHGTWVQEEPHRLPYAINEAARTVLVRYPGAFNCVGFTKALRMLEEERGTDVGPSEWDYVDLRSQYPLHEHGDQFTVVAYAQDQKPPTVFYVTLTRAGHLSWRLHTQLLRHILGTSAPDFQTFFHAWSPISQSWDAINPDDPFTPFHLHDFMVVRHKANSATPGLPRFLRLLDEQTLYPHNQLPADVCDQAHHIPARLCKHQFGRDHSSQAQVDGERLPGHDDSAAEVNSPAPAQKHGSAFECCNFLPDLPHPTIRIPSAPLLVELMRLYRAYPQPDNPAAYRPLELDVPEDEVKYTKQLKTACLLAAGPQPEAPRICPRCGQPTTFDSRLCYKYGIAGAWNMFCRACRKVHIPMQVGPSEEDLEKIESIRDRDRQALRARKTEQARVRADKQATKDKKARERAAKAAAKTHKARDGELPNTERDRPRVADRANSKNAVSRELCPPATYEKPRPLGMISNAMTIADAKRREEPPSHAGQVSARRTTVNHAGNARPHGEDAMSISNEAFDPEPRTVLLLLWVKFDQDPFMERVAVPLGSDGIFLYHYPQVRAIPAPTEFERWVIRSNVWSLVPWEISPIEVGDEDDVIFVRVMGIRCRGFGLHLHDYQLKRGQALTRDLSIARAIYEPPERHRWILVWTQNNARPDIFLFNAALMDDEQEGAPLPRPWLDLLRDASFFLVWHETHTRWVGVLRGESPGVPDDAPIVLLAHPGVENLLGSGEAIAWFETWRARGDLNSRDSTPSDRLRAPSALVSDEDTIMPPTAKRVISKRARDLSHDAPPLRAAQAHKKARTSLPLRTRAHPSDDEVEFVKVSRLPSNHGLPTRNPLDNGVAPIDRSRRASKCPGDTATNPLIVLDGPATPTKVRRSGRDERPEFVEGSSKTPMKGKTSVWQEGVELDWNGNEVIDLTDERRSGRTSPRRSGDSAQPDDPAMSVWPDRDVRAVPAWTPHPAPLDGISVINIARLTNTPSVLPLAFLDVCPTGAAVLKGVLRGEPLCFTEGLATPELERCARRPPGDDGLREQGRRAHLQA
ncbi:hypothetical protein LXA43DRAFT_1098475 [Ganoderma leucocontextum]|nr:hypothetical protein LXA43DRAFT_1098475 [Ganoderma leucocontextum]